jgi:hypothetical protein
MAEVHRIAQPGAEVTIVTPHYGSRDSFTNPTHLFHPAVHSFDYFERNSTEDFTYQGGGFRILERQLTFGGNFLLDSLARMFAANSLDFYEKHLAWIFPARSIICRLSISK